MCTWVYVQCTCVNTHVEARGHTQLLFCFSYHPPCSLAKDISLAWGLPTKWDWLDSEPQDLLPREPQDLSTSSALGLQVHIFMPDFLHGFWEWDSSYAWQGPTFYELNFVPSLTSPEWNHICRCKVFRKHFNSKANHVHKWRWWLSLYRCSSGVGIVMLSRNSATETSLHIIQVWLWKPQSSAGQVICLYTNNSTLYSGTLIENKSAATDFYTLGVHRQSREASELSDFYWY